MRSDILIKVIVRTINILGCSGLMLWSGMESIRAEENRVHSDIASNNTSLNPASAIPVKALPKDSTDAIDLWAQDSSPSTLVKITAVKLNPISNGIEVELVSDGSSTSQPIRRTEGNTVIAEIENAVLALPEGPGFQTANPVPGVISVSVMQLDNTTIQVRIVGTTAAPTASVKLNEAIAAQPQPANPMQPNEPDASDESDEGEEEMVVTGQKEPSYRAPNASTATKTDTALRDIPQSIQVVPRQA